MTERIRKQLDHLRKREYRNARKHTDMDLSGKLSGMDIMLRNANLMAAMTRLQEPTFTLDDRIGFHRSHVEYPYVIDWEGNRFSMFHSSGNIVPDFQTTLNLGMDALIENARNWRQNSGEEKKSFYDAVILSAEAALELADKYREYCKDHGNRQLYDALCVVPHKGAETFLQACVFVKFLIFTIRCNGNDHIALGRFDQYMYPYFLADKKQGMSDDQLLKPLKNSLSP